MSLGDGRFRKVPNRSNGGSAGSTLRPSRRQPQSLAIWVALETHSSTPSGEGRTRPSTRAFEWPAVTPAPRYRRAVARIDVVVVAYNSRDELAACVGELSRAPDVEVFVVDN